MNIFSANFYPSVQNQSTLQLIYHQDLLRLRYLSGKSLGSKWAKCQEASQKKRVLAETEREKGKKALLALASEWRAA